MRQGECACGMWIFTCISLRDTHISYNLPSAVLRGPSTSNFIHKRMPNILLLQFVEVIQDLVIPGLFVPGFFSLVLVVKDSCFVREAPQHKSVGTICVD